MAGRPGHRRAKTAGIGQLEAFDGLSLQVDAYDRFVNEQDAETGGAALNMNLGPRYSLGRGRQDAGAGPTLANGRTTATMEQTFAETSVQDFAITQLGSTRRLSLLPPSSSMLGTDEDREEDLGDEDDEVSDLATMRSTIHLVDTEQVHFPERKSTLRAAGGDAEDALKVRKSLRFSVAGEQKILRGLEVSPDEALIAKLRVLEKAEGNQFVSIIDAWEALHVSESGDMIADEFIAAMKSILIVVDALGGALSVIKSDWNSQMEKVKASCVKHGTVTLHRMIECENAKGEGTDCLIWMKRSLQFVEIMMTRFLDDSSLPDSVEIAYKRTLHDAHPWVVRLVAGKIRFAVPGDEVFLDRLYKPDHGLVREAIGLFLRIMRPKLAALITFYNVNNIERVKNCQVLPEAVPAQTVLVLA